MTYKSAIYKHSQLDRSTVAYLSMGGLFVAIVATIRLLALLLANNYRGRIVVPRYCLFVRYVVPNVYLIMEQPAQPQTSPSRDTMLPTAVTMKQRNGNQQSVTNPLRVHLITHSLGLCQLDNTSY